MSEAVIEALVRRLEDAAIASAVANIMGGSPEDLERLTRVQDARRQLVLDALARN